MSDRAHVRRGDKVAGYSRVGLWHEVEEYMGPIARHYALRERSEHASRRRVYLASDDPRILAEMKSK